MKTLNLPFHFQRLCVNTFQSTLKPSNAGPFNLNSKANVIYLAIGSHCSRLNSEMRTNTREGTPTTTRESVPEGPYINESRHLDSNSFWPVKARDTPQVRA